MTPIQLCKSTKEKGTQTALFAWANMAQVHGWEAADQDASYTAKGHAAKLLALHNDAEPRLKWLHAIHNQGHGDAIRGAANKAQGVKAGVSDIMLPVRSNVRLIIDNGFNTQVKYSGLYIELKRETGGHASKEQKEFGEFVISQGYMYKCIIGWFLASRVIKEYLR